MEKIYSKQKENSVIQPKFARRTRSVRDYRSKNAVLKNQIALMQGNGFIQRKAPVAVTYSGDLTHGTVVSEFDTTRPALTGFTSTTDTAKPAAPAWMAPGAGHGDEEFSILAPLVTQGYARLHRNDKKSLFVHTYRKGTTDLQLNQWEEWRFVPEYLYSKKAKGRRPHYSLGKDRDTIAMAFAKKHTVHKFHFNSPEAARVIKNGDSEKHGYRIEKDLVLKKPEIVLFEKGLTAINSAGKKEFEVTCTKEAKVPEFDIDPKGGGQAYHCKLDKSDLKLDKK